MADGDTSYDAALDSVVEGDDEGGEPKAPEPTPKKAAAKEPQEQRKNVQRASAKTEDTADDEGEDDKSEPKSPVKADSPWKTELAKRGIDLPEVDQYMREVVQPYITRLEQQGGEISSMFEGDSEVAGVAAGIIQGLEENPAATLAKIIEAMDIDPDEINAAFSDAEGGDEGPEGNEPIPGQQPLEDEQPEGTSDPVLTWAQQKMQEEEAAQQTEAYEKYLDTLAQEVPNFDKDLYSLALASVGDNIEQAMPLYEALAERYQGRQAPTPPPVAGRRSQGTLPQEPQKEYSGRTGLDDAIGDFLAEEKVRSGR